MIFIHGSRCTEVYVGRKESLRLDKPRRLMTTDEKWILYNMVFYLRRSWCKNGEVMSTTAELPTGLNITPQLLGIRLVYLELNSWNRIVTVGFHMSPTIGQVGARPVLTVE